MPTPILYVVAGPNGAGKTTYFERILGPATRLPFVNADLLAQERWADDPAGYAYQAAELAAEIRRAWLAERRSFATETVFSHPSKLDLLREARRAGYRLSLHVILIPEELAVRRVEARVRTGGHDVPEEKIRERYVRLWRLVRQAVALAHEALILDNSRAATPFRRVARYEVGQLMGPADLPAWAPAELGRSDPVG